MAYADNDHDTNDYCNPFGKAAAFYPAKVTNVERHPDKRRSSSLIDWSDDATKDLRCVMEVRGEGALVLRSSSGHPDGRLRFEGISLFTHDEILFDK